ncbi:MAG: hypothetical protein J5707_01610 [Candidatus Methanomethylophilus sp.]|nr:hypothetical protein [Methanomethylophilus sp.]
MAKKRRLIKEEPEEEYQFTPTDFDEREFLLKGIYSTKVLLLGIILAIVVGIATARISIAMGMDVTAAVVDTLLVFFVCAIMKKLFVAMHIRADLLETKTMLGVYFIYLCLALGVCILFVNAPFA